MHVLGVRWFLADNQLYKHGLQVWSDEEKGPVMKDLSQGTTITWILTGPRRCVGYRDSQGRDRRCPERALVKSGQKRCGPCSAMDFYDECVYCDGSICRASPERRERCRNANYSVYATVFGDAILKVGVSVRERLMIRWLEQGADVGAVLAEIRDGKRARTLERLLSQNANVTKSVRFGRKLDALTRPISLAEAEKMVQSFCDSAVFSEAFSKSGLEPQKLKLRLLDSYYGLPQVDTVPNVWPGGSRGLHGQQILGEILGMKGPLLLVETGKVMTSINLKRLVGYTIDEESEVNYVSQSSLLEHF